jgi:hypothetical protein
MPTAGHTIGELRGGWSDSCLQWKLKLDRIMGDKRPTFCYTHHSEVSPLTAIQLLLLLRKEGTEYSYFGLKIQEAMHHFYYEYGSIIM